MRIGVVCPYAVDVPGGVQLHVRDQARELRRRGAVAVHANRHTDLPAAVCAAYLYSEHGVDPADGLSAAAAAGLVVTPEAAVLVGADYELVQPRSAIAAATSSGRSVTT